MAHRDAGGGAVHSIKCSRVAWLDKQAVMRKIGGNQYLLNLRGKLKCECGNKQGNDVLIGYLDRNI